MTGESGEKDGQQHLRKPNQPGIFKGPQNHSNQVTWGVLKWKGGRNWWFYRPGNQGNELSLNLKKRTAPKKKKKRNHLKSGKKKAKNRPQCGCGEGGPEHGVVRNGLSSKKE